jgi:NADPH:quinone reductase-like Zn-dependent oxidoreductase
MVRAIGADRTIDYGSEDFTLGGARYDVIFDCVGNHSMRACGRVLVPGGAYVGAGAVRGRWMIGAMARTVTGPLL